MMVPAFVCVCVHECVRFVCGRPCVFACVRGRALPFAVVFQPKTARNRRLGTSPPSCSRRRGWRRCRLPPARTMTSLRAPRPRPRPPTTAAETRRPRATSSPRISSRMTTDHYFGINFLFFVSLAAASAASAKPHAIAACCRR